MSRPATTPMHRFPVLPLLCAVVACHTQRDVAVDTDVEVDSAAVLESDPLPKDTDTDTDTDLIVDSADSDLPVQPPDYARTAPMVHVDEASACAIDLTGNATCWGEYAPARLVSGDTGVNLEQEGPFSIVCNRSGMAIATRPGEWGAAIWPAGAYRTGWNDLAGDARYWVDLDCAPAAGNGLCGIDTDGRLFCYDTRAGTIPSTPGWLKVSVGIRSVCAIHATDGLQCWGDVNRIGTFGTHSSDAIDVAVGGGGTCILRPDHTVACQGFPEITEHVPTDLDDARTIAVGGAYACVLRQTGQIRCFGHTDLRQTDKVVTDVPEGNDFVFVDVDYEHACASRADGSVVCWGRNNGGVVQGVPQIP